MMNSGGNAWVVRPYPHGKYRMHEFLGKNMVAIGWPDTGNLGSLTRNQISDILRKKYYSGANSKVVGQVTGIVDRFVNQIKPNDFVIVPDGNLVYFAVAKSVYEFHPELQSDDKGYPHWISVEWQFDKKPLARMELPATLFDSLKGRQTVYAVSIDIVHPIINDPSRFIAFDSVFHHEYQSTYIDRLSKGTVPGINSPSFEQAVVKVLRFYFPGIHRLATTSSPVGADTDLIAELPGSVVVRVQVKCFQDAGGALDEWVVRQLRDSMEIGQNGIIVTTNRINEQARKLAEVDPEKPIGFIEVAEFAQLVFENLPSLSDGELWSLGLKRAISGR